jgi:Synergist-CTERM protein sorting domain-containing protein
VVNGLVTGEAVGTATITVTTDDGGYTAPCIINVINKPVTSVLLSQNTLTLDVGHTRTLTVSILPPDATIKTVAWSSSNPSVASVTSTGVVEGLSEGTAMVKVSTPDGPQDTCIVTVKKQAPIDPTYPNDKDNVSGKTGINADSFEVKNNMVYLKKELAEAIAKALLGSNTAVVNIEPVFEGDMTSRGVGNVGQVAELTFKVAGEDLLALFAEDIVLIGMTSGNSGKRFTYVDDPAKLADKMFTLLLGGSVYHGEIKSGVIYDLIVCIQDGSEFDLDGAINGEVISSMFFAAESRRGSGGGGGCNAGYAYLALALFGAAPLVLRRK